jgi:hypothetical protein
MSRADDLTFAFVAFASFPVVDEMIGDPRHDVIIVGGDPAGAATALSLRSHAPDLSVAMIEQTNYHAMRIGETLPPLVQPLLERIGVWQAFWLKITCRLMARARHGVPMRCTRTSSSFNLRSADGIWIDDPLMKWSRVKRRVEALFCTPTQARREKRWAPLSVWQRRHERIPAEPDKLPQSAVQFTQELGNDAGTAACSG